MVYLAICNAGKGDLYLLRFVTPLSFSLTDIAFVGVRTKGFTSSIRNLHRRGLFDIIGKSGC